MVCGCLVPQPHLKWLNFYDGCSCYWCLLLCDDSHYYAIPYSYSYVIFGSSKNHESTKQFIAREDTGRLHPFGIFYAFIIQDRGKIDETKKKPTHRTIDEASQRIEYYISRSTIQINHNNCLHCMLYSFIWVNELEKMYLIGNVNRLSSTWMLLLSSSSSLMARFV